MAIDPATLALLYAHAPDIAAGGLLLIVILTALSVALYHRYQLRKAEGTGSRFRGSTPADDALRAEIPTTDMGGMLFPNTYAPPPTRSRFYAENLAVRKG